MSKEVNCLGWQNKQSQRLLYCGVGCKSQLHHPQKQLALALWEETAVAHHLQLNVKPCWHLKKKILTDKVLQFLQVKRLDSFFPDNQKKENILEI